MKLCYDPFEKSIQNVVANVLNSEIQKNNSLINWLSIVSKNYRCVDLGKILNNAI